MGQSLSTATATALAFGVAPNLLKSLVSYD